MSEYFEKAKLLKHIAERETDANLAVRQRSGVGEASMFYAAWLACVKKFRGIVNAFPTVDATQIIRGHWAHLGGDEWCCSACGFVITSEGSWEHPKKKFCEECGARMDGDTK